MWVGDLHTVKHLRYTESLPCLNGTAASRYVEENFQKTVGFLIKSIRGMIGFDDVS